MTRRIRSVAHAPWRGRKAAGKAFGVWSGPLLVDAFLLSLRVRGVGFVAGTPARLSGGRGAGFALRLARCIRVLRPAGMAACGQASWCGSLHRLDRLDHVGQGRKRFGFSGVTCFSPQCGARHPVAAITLTGHSSRAPAWPSRSFSAKNFWVDGFVFSLKKKSVKSNVNSVCCCLGLWTT